MSTTPSHTPAAPPPPPHAPVASGSDIERMIEGSGCSGPYFALEECMGEHNRAWSKCQREVRELAACNREQLAKARAQAPQ